MAHQEPVMLAMILCRDIVGETFEPTLSGVLDVMDVPAFPYKVPPHSLKMYAALADVHGGYELTFRISLRDEVIEESVLRAGERSSPLDDRAMMVDLTDQIFSEAGQYVFDLIWSGKILVSRRLEVRLADHRARSA